MSIIIEATFKTSAKRYTLICIHACLSYFENQFSSIFFYIAEWYFQAHNTMHRK